MTVVIQGPKHPALSEGSRPFWAKLSPVHERLGLRALAPDRIQGDAVFPHSSFTAQSPITSRRLTLRPIVPTLQLRAVLAAVKVWPSEGGACRTRAATANLDRGCARRLCIIEVGTKKRRGRTKKLSQTTKFAMPRENTNRTSQNDLLTIQPPYKDDGVGEFKSLSAHRSQAKPASHSWRAREDEREPEKTVAAKIPRRAPGGTTRPREQPAGEMRQDMRQEMLTDRKGRRVPVGAPRAGAAPRTAGKRRKRQPARPGPAGAAAALLA